MQGQQLDAQINRSSLICLDHIEFHVGLDYMDYKKIKKVSTLDLELRFMSISGQVSFSIPLYRTLQLFQFLD